jgi:hypothetical protein
LICQKAKECACSLLRAAGPVPPAGPRERSEAFPVRETAGRKYPRSEAAWFGRMCRIGRTSRPLPASARHVARGCIVSRLLRVSPCKAKLDITLTQVPTKLLIARSPTRACRCSPHRPGGARCPVPTRIRSHGGANASLFARHELGGKRAGEPRAKVRERG